MQQVAGHDVGLDPCDQRLQGLHGPPAPADQRAFGDIRAHAGEDLVLAIEGKVIVELRDQHMRQQVRSCHTARDRTAGCGLLHHLLTAATGFLDAGDLDHLHLRHDHVEQFADILAHHAQITATVGTACARIKLPPFTQGRIRHTWAATQNRRRRLISRWFVLPFVDGCLVFLSHRNQQVFQRQFQLFDFTLDLFRGFAEGQFLQFGDPQTQRLNQLIMDAQCCRYLCVF